MIVVKIGGSEGVDLDALCRDAAAIIKGGERLVIVHGGSHLTGVLGEKLGCPPRFITSPSGHTSRRTDRPTLEAFQMACALLNARIVERLSALGIAAIGLSGMDGRLWEGSRKDAVRSVEDGRIVIVRDDYTGAVERVNAGLVRSLLEGGYTPVLSPPGITPAGEPINVDADRAAARTASALGASRLLLLSNVAGVLRSFPDESSLVPSISKAQIDSFIELAGGRMKKKILGAGEALSGGVERVVIGDARIERPIARALEGAGTVLA